MDSGGRYGAGFVIRGFNSRLIIAGGSCSCFHNISFPEADESR